MATEKDPKKELTVLEEKEQETLESGECCDPVCGPTTCEPAVEAKAEEEPKETSSGCGPSTCS